VPEARPSSLPPRLLVLVINLDRSTDRLQRIGKRLDALGLSWERLPASDGRQLDMNDPALIDREEFGRRHGKRPLPGELGCYLSHVRALRRLMASDAEFGLVLEDDGRLQDSLPGIVNQLMQASTDWDLVKFSGVHHGHPRALRAIDAQHDLVVMLTKCTVSSGYLIKRKAAGVLAQGLLPMRIPFDHEFDRGWHWGLKVRYVRPYPILHDDTVASTISRADSKDNPRFHWTRRLPAFGWRALNEWARLRYGLSAWRQSDGA
jgi:glycosyl transferase family 25